MKLFKDEEKSVEWRYGGARNADSTQNLHIYHFKRFLSNYGSFKSFGSMEISKWCQFLKLYQTNGIMQRQQQHRHRKIGLSLTIGQFLAWFLWKHSIIWPNFGISLIKLKSFYLLCDNFAEKSLNFPLICKYVKKPVKSRLLPDNVVSKHHFEYLWCFLELQLFFWW